MSSSHRYSLSVSGLLLELETDQRLIVQEAFLPFMAEKADPDIMVSFRRVEQLPPIPNRVIHEDLCYRVHQREDGSFIRSFFDAPRDHEPYAVVAADYSGGKILVEYLEKGAHCVSELRNSFVHMGLERILCYRERLCIHASCIRTELGGILFSGPSGIGKSTQAALWCTHRNAEQINGDRPILSRGDEGWLAWGSPYAGSSRCYVNESCPVNAIVMLRQAERCSIRRLNPKEAFRAVWSGLTVPGWDAKAVETACDLALELSAAVPVYEFACTPDAAAVDFLERALEEEAAL